MRYAALRRSMESRYYSWFNVPHNNEIIFLLYCELVDKKTDSKHDVIVISSITIVSELIKDFCMYSTMPKKLYPKLDYVWHPTVPNSQHCSQRSWCWDGWNRHPKGEYQLLQIVYKLLTDSNFTGTSGFYTYISSHFSFGCQSPPPNASHWQ